MQQAIVSNTRKLLLFDDEDVKLFTGKTFYTSDGKYVHVYDRVPLYVHRIIMNVHYRPPSVMVDHKDHDGFNCQKTNLRLCNTQQNVANSGPRRTNNSGFKGVCLCNKSGKWRATITFNGKQIHIGLYSDVVEAALAYDKRARFLFGEFAFLNFPGLINAHLEDNIQRKTQEKHEWHQQSVA
jgi:hypothetical protein